MTCGPCGVSWTTDFQPHISYFHRFFWYFHNLQYFLQKIASKLLIKPKNRVCFRFSMLQNNQKSWTIHEKPHFFDGFDDFTILQSYNITISQYYNITTVQYCSNVILQYCSITILQYCNVIIRNVTTLQNYNIAILQYYNITILQYCSIAVLQC